MRTGRAACDAAVGGPSSHRAVPLLLLAALAAAVLPAPAAAHGFIIAPAARNYVRNWNWCPHCVNGGGPAATSRGGQLAWPASAAAACGDASLATAGAPVATYHAGAGEGCRVGRVCVQGLPGRSQHAYRDVAAALLSRFELADLSRQPPLNPSSPSAAIDIQLFITAQHGGRHVFRLCRGPNMTAACLTAPTAVLQRCV